MKENAEWWKEKQNCHNLHTITVYLENENKRVQDTKVSVTVLYRDHFENASIKNNYLQTEIKTT